MRGLFAYAWLALLGSARADPAIDPCACSPNKPGFHRSSALTGDWNGLRADLFERGIKIQATYAGELFASPTLDGDQVAAAGLAALGVEVDLGKAIADRLGSFKVSGFAIHGHGLSQGLADDPARRAAAADA